MADDRPPRRGPYDRPRILVAGALTLLVVGLAAWDAGHAEYQASEVTMSVLLGTILTLLGLELNDVLRGGRR